VPLVFVHGVATRQTPEYQAKVSQRDALFQRLVLPPGSVAPFDPDWGSNGVKFDPALPWLPSPNTAEAFAAGQSSLAGQSGIARLASKKPDVAIDLAFQAGLSARAATSQPLEEDEIAAFEAAVKYLERGPDKGAFDPARSDAEFLTDLAAELNAPTATDSRASEPMSVTSNTLAWLGRGLKDLVDPVANVTSDAVLRVVRRPLSNQVALFLGDIFVYLRWRETDNEKAASNRIFCPIADSLAQAANLRSTNDPLIVVGHSLGGVILYDLLTDRSALASLNQRIGTELIIDTLVTVGSQPGLFADMGLYSNVTKGVDGRYPCPAPVRNWLNVYDYTDMLSFACEPLFTKARDFEFDSVTSVLEAHSAYFQRPSFYSRLRARLRRSS
jgi:hypothetical protein